MSGRRIRLDDLIGRVIRDASGRAVGRIHDMTVEERNGELVVVDYRIGSEAFLRRIGVNALRLVGLGGGRPRRLRWDRVDLSDPERPTLVDAQAARG